MTPDIALKFFENIIKLVGVLVWPGLALLFLLKFQPAIKSFLRGLRKVSFTAPGIQFSAESRVIAKTVAAVTAANMSKTGQNVTPVTTEAEARRTERILEEYGPHALRELYGTNILWVDDNPENNVYERAALQALGFRVHISTSTEDALAARQHRFALIISDMKRPPDNQAGFTLLKSLRSQGDKTPLIIYTGGRAFELLAEAKRQGAADCVNTVNELLRSVLQITAERLSN